MDISISSVELQYEGTYSGELDSGVSDVGPKLQNQLHCQRSSLVGVSGRILDVAVRDRGRGVRNGSRMEDTRHRHGRKGREREI